MCNDCLRVDADVVVVVVCVHVGLDVGGDGVKVGIVVSWFRYWCSHRCRVLYR